MTNATRTRTGTGTGTRTGVGVEKAKALESRNDTQFISSPEIGTTDADMRNVPPTHTISTLRTILGQFDSYQDEEVPVHVADADADADADETASS